MTKSGGGVGPCENPPGRGTGTTGRFGLARTPAAALVAKRALDIAVSAVTFGVTLPVQLLAGLAVVAEDGRPVLYRQLRAGRDGRTFQIYKLRTMRVHDTVAADMAQVRGDSPLVTRTGRVLRRLRIDEMPQLLAVLRGDMSLIGPRPALPEQAARYDAFERRRLAVRPGMTGWAQVCGNTELTWSERITLDVWYIDHWSLLLDFAILARTLGVVVRGERRRPEALAEAERHAERTGRCS